MHFYSLWLIETPRKRGHPKKAAVKLENRYSAINYSAVNLDEEKIASDSLSKEMHNQKPRRQVFLPLMKTTFDLRRHYIIHHATSVQSILSDYQESMCCNLPRSIIIHLGYVPYYHK